MTTSKMMQELDKLEEQIRSGGSIKAALLQAVGLGLDHAEEITKQVKEENNAKV